MEVHPYQIVVRSETGEHVLARLSTLSTGGGLMRDAVIEASCTIMDASGLFPGINPTSVCLYWDTSAESSIKKNEQITYGSTVYMRSRKGDIPPPLEIIPNHELLGERVAAANERDELRKDLAAIKAESRNITQEIALFEEKNSRDMLHLERVRGGRMSPIWYALVCVSLACTIGPASASTVLTLLNLAGFLMTWRRLYISSSSRAYMLATFLIVAYTIKFT